jgi:hypothetical protein
MTSRQLDESVARFEQHATLTDAELTQKRNKARRRRGTKRESGEAARRARRDGRRQRPREREGVRAPRVKRW